MCELRPESVPAILEQASIGVGEILAVEPIGDWIANRVVRVRTTERCLILKQPLARYDIAESRPVDLNRVHVEAAALERIGRYSDPVSGRTVAVPDLVFKDDADRILGIACVPTDARLWRTQLLEGTVCEAVGTALGEWLGRLHRRSAAAADRWSAFGQTTDYRRNIMRMDIHHDAVAKRHPEIADAVERTVSDVLASEEAFVHGDFCPRNVLAGDDVWVIDFECAHWGCRAVDTACMLNYLFLKSLRNHEIQSSYLALAEAFVDAYGFEDASRESLTVRELAIKMLARIDGRSPAGWIERVETKEAIRSAATYVLESDLQALQDVVSAVRDHAPERD